MPLARDLLHPSLEEEKKKHKKKRLVQSPNSYFMDVKCPGCYKITTVFSHAQTVVLCVGCSTVLCQPTGGKARLTEGSCEFHVIFTGRVISGLATNPRSIWVFI
uniref:40S ribosomal protein S27 n=1 Tax=Rousettus aegyptiacus TaxID=9407 RepID=A0A7J8ISC1_ROUAE|nr:ribosomal protein S27 like [Rousettus aegyptiacus]